MLYLELWVLVACIMYLIGGWHYFGSGKGEDYLRSLIIGLTIIAAILAGFIWSIVRLVERFF